MSIGPGLIVGGRGNDFSHESAHRNSLERRDEHFCQLVDAPPSGLSMRQVRGVAEPAWCRVQLWPEIVLGATDPLGRRRNGRTSSQRRSHIVFAPQPGVRTPQLGKLLYVRRITPRGAEGGKSSGANSRVGGGSR